MDLASPAVSGTSVYANGLTLPIFDSNYTDEHTFCNLCHSDNPHMDVIRKI